jgi:hypothetical protein
MREVGLFCFTSFSEESRWFGREVTHLANAFLVVQPLIVIRSDVTASSGAKNHLSPRCGLFVLVYRSNLPSISLRLYLCARRYLSFPLFSLIGSLSPLSLSFWIASSIPMPTTLPSVLPTPSSLCRHDTLSDSSPSPHSDFATFFLRFSLMIYTDTMNTIDPREAPGRRERDTAVRDEGGGGRDGCTCWPLRLRLKGVGRSGW